MSLFHPYMLGVGAAYSYSSHTCFKWCFLHLEHDPGLLLFLLIVKLLQNPQHFFVYLALPSTH